MKSDALQKVDAKINTGIRLVESSIKRIRAALAEAELGLEELKAISQDFEDES
jgi:hypothetical protein